MADQEANNGEGGMLPHDRRFTPRPRTDTEEVEVGSMVAGSSAPSVVNYNPEDPQSPQTSPTDVVAGLGHQFQDVRTSMARHEVDEQRAYDSASITSRDTGSERGEGSSQQPRSQLHDLQRSGSTKRRGSDMSNSSIPRRRLRINPPSSRSMSSRSTSSQQRLPIGSGHHQLVDLGNQTHDSPLPMTDDETANDSEFCTDDGETEDDDDGPETPTQ